MKVEEEAREKKWIRRDEDGAKQIIGEKEKKKDIIRKNTQQGK